VTSNRSRKAIIAAIVTVLWLGYMVVGLAVLDAVAPTENGSGPAGVAAFVGLVSGLVACGFIMWAASE
jgi:hypothetical protein